MRRAFCPGASVVPVFVGVEHDPDSIRQYADCCILHGFSPSRWCSAIFIQIYMHKCMVGGLFGRGSPLADGRVQAIQRSG